MKYRFLLFIIGSDISQQPAARHISDAEKMEVSLAQFWQILFIVFTLL